jgi:hypothetical protein
MNDLKQNMYLVYSISNSPFQEWQADLLDYSIAEAKQPGTVIRLCSQDRRYPGRETPQSKSGITINTPNFSRISPDKDWPVMNKPGSLKYLFKDNIVSDHDTLIFLDPDMIFTKKWVPDVGRGIALGQKWKGYGHQYCQKTSILPELCPVKEVDCLMYPFAIKAENMKKIIEDIEAFAKEGYLKCNDWMADMSAFVTAMVKNKIKMATIDNIGLCNNWDNHNDKTAPIMHYCRPIRDSSDNIIWGKWRYKPWSMPPEPSQATNHVDREVLKMLRKYILSMACES